MMIRLAPPPTLAVMLLCGALSAACGSSEGDNGGGTVHTISLIDVDDFENPSVHWSAMTGMFGRADWTIQVNGENVTAEATFDDGRTDREIEEVRGSLEATCPARQR